MKRGRERSTSLSSSSSNSTFYVNLVEEVPQDVFPVRIEFLEHFVLDEEDEDAFLEDETDCGDTLSELSCSNSQRLDGYGSGEYCALALSAARTRLRLSGHLRTLFTEHPRGAQVTPHHRQILRR